MRFIKKTVAPQCLIDYVSEQRAASLEIGYNLFPHKRALNDALRAEQHSICCYCQRTIDHFNTPALRGSRNEHLYPENRQDDPKSQELQLEYTNIFACCMDSMGHNKREKHLMYCDVAKGNQLIRGFIQEENCEENFRYNILGEIIPNGDYGTWNDYKDDPTLTGSLLDARNTIAILNLNSPTLVADRKDCVTDLVKYFSNRSREQIETIVSSWINSEQYPPYLSLRLQLVARRLAKQA